MTGNGTWPRCVRCGNTFTDANEYLEHCCNPQPSRRRYDLVTALLIAAVCAVPAAAMYGAVDLRAERPDFTPTTNPWGGP